MEQGTKGPLSGLRVAALGGVGPVPFCAMLLADLGADVIRVDRPSEGDGVDPFRVLSRGQRSIVLDLKDKNGSAVARRLIETVDVVLEGFRPGVMERLGLGPDLCEVANPRLIYARMTGWGQSGPLARCPGHDINYIALSGVLHAIGSAGGPPALPLNLIGDFAGGGQLLAFAILAALYERERSGTGQVIDAAMLDGASLLMTGIHGMKAAGMLAQPRGRNQVDGGAHFYTTYECADGKHIAVGAMEPAFYADLLRRCEVESTDFDRQWDPATWPDRKAKLARVFLARTRDEWAALLEGTDACVSPVLSLDEAPKHPHNVFRNNFVETEGIQLPSPAPRFSRTPADTPGRIPAIGEDTDEILRELGVGA